MIFNSGIGVTNHSEELANIAIDPLTMWAIAVKDIRPNQQLFINYWNLIVPTWHDDWMTDEGLYKDEEQFRGYYKWMNATDEKADWNEKLMIVSDFDMVEEMRKLVYRKPRK